MLKIVVYLLNQRKKPRDLIKPNMYNFTWVTVKKHVFCKNRFTVRRVCTQPSLSKLHLQSSFLRNWLSLFLLTLMSVLQWTPSLTNRSPSTVRKVDRNCNMKWNPYFKKIHKSKQNTTKCCEVKCSLYLHNIY